MDSTPFSLQLQDRPANRPNIQISNRQFHVHLFRYLAFPIFLLLSSQAFTLNFQCKSPSRPASPVPWAPNRSKALWSSPIRLAVSFSIPNSLPPQSTGTCTSPEPKCLLEVPNGTTAGYLRPTTRSRVRRLGGMGLGAVPLVNPRHSEYEGLAYAITCRHL